MAELEMRHVDGDRRRLRVAAWNHEPESASFCMVTVAEPGDTDDDAPSVFLHRHDVVVLRNFLTAVLDG
jgi:hypothetical protein